MRLIPSFQKPNITVTAALRADLFPLFFILRKCFLNCLGVQQELLNFLKSFFLFFHCLFLPLPSFSLLTVKVAIIEHLQLFFFGLFAISWAAPSAYGGSQARGLIGAAATGLQSHSSAGSELRQKPTPQLMATLDPQPTEQGQGWNPQPCGS